MSAYTKEEMAAAVKAGYHVMDDMPLAARSFIDGYRAALASREGEAAVDVREVFIAGFRYCATEWADRQDLFSDVHSAAFANGMEFILNKGNYLRDTHPHAAVPDGMVLIYESIIAMAIRDMSAMQKHCPVEENIFTNSTIKLLDKFVTTKERTE